MPCEAITTIPWYEGFESVWFVAFGLNTGTHPWCWTNINGGSKWTLEKNNYLFLYSFRFRSLQIYGSTTAGLSGDWFISPTISLRKLKILGKRIFNIYILSVKILDVTTNGLLR